jgi:NAD(P)-dependent dehydrogenase (short-subunit alcohol dehydrogenase family)
MLVRGRTVLVTGSTGGIGKETARGLVERGARVVLVGRDRGRAEAAVRELGVGGAEVSAVTADITGLAGLRAVARQVAERTDRLDVLVNNLGGMVGRRTLTGDGVEATFAANVLAPFTLTCLLLPLLRAAPGARVVNLTGGIPGGPIDVTDLQGERRYRGWLFSQYNQAKTALMAMSRRFAARVDGVAVNVAYPGHAYTPGNRALEVEAFPYLYRPIVPVLRVVGPRLMSDFAKAARSTIHLATSPELDGVTGIYVDSRGRRTPWPAGARDERAADAVWQHCVELSGLSPR